MASEESASERRRNSYRSQLDSDIYWGIGIAAFRDPCGVNLDIPPALPEPKLEDIKEGYMMSVDVETGEVSYKEIRNGEVIEPVELIDPGIVT